MNSQPGSTGTYHNGDSADPFRITRDQYLADRNGKTRGTANPSIMDKLFWKYMILRRGNAYEARRLFDKEEDLYKDREFEDAENPDWPFYPVWCFSRFGRTVTTLPDGRYVYIGGEHEDSYDPDFAIYNDVVVINRPVASSATEELLVDGYSYPLATRKPTYDDMPLTEDINIYGYPVEVFPPTDFHTSTYFCDPTSGKESIFIIGGLGYRYNASRDRTDVYRLDVSDFSMQRLETTGTKPSGGTHEHYAQLVGGGHGTEPAIRISTKDGKGFSLLINILEWVSHGSVPT